MKIAIDIDKTLFDCKKSLVYQVASTLEKVLPKRPKQPKYLSLEEAKYIPVKYRNLFGKMGDPEKYEEVEGSVEIIKKFTKEGHQVAFLSSRPNMRIMNNVVLSWIQKHDIPHDFIVVNCTDKASFCKEHGIDVLIDDGIKNCKKTNKENISTIYLNPDKGFNIDKANIVNKDKFYVANGWGEVEKNINLIEQKREKNNTKNNLENQEGLEL